MRARLESFMHDTWYGGRGPGLFLRVLEPVYRWGYTAAQKREQAACAEDLSGMPIVVVGNLNAGGTGKTPLVVHLCQLLLRAGLNPGVASRGYGRRVRHDIQVARHHDPRDTGDEPLLIHRRCGVPVLVAENRVTAARSLFRQGADVVISDDGLQRRRLPRAMEICVVDGSLGFGNGRLLPAGPLREPLQRLASVDYVVCNGAARHPSLPGDCVAMNLRPGQPASLSGEAKSSIAELARRSRAEPVVAVAAIGNPKRFFRSLEELGIRVTPRPFADHHRFSARDFDALRGATVLMTEKDAVKCAGFGLENAWYLPVDAAMPDAWDTEFVRRCVALAEPRDQSR